MTTIGYIGRTDAEGSWVRLEDFKALATRLAEAERLLGEARTVLGVIGGEYQRKVGPYATQAQSVGQRIAGFLSTADSAEPRESA